jgi:hypothetical protein
VFAVPRGVKAIFSWLFQTIPQRWNVHDFCNGLRLTVSEIIDRILRCNSGLWFDFICWMALVELVHPQGSYQVSVVLLITKCDLFKNNPALIMTPYRVQSGVPLEDFQDFVTALEDKPMEIKDRNFLGLSQLSEEFGFQALLAKLSTHRRSPGLSDAQTAECRSRISALEERIGLHEDQLAALQSALFPALRRFEADLARLRIGNIPRHCPPSGSRTASERSGEVSARHSSISCRNARPAEFADCWRISAAV